MRIEIAKLSKRYEYQWIIKDFSFQFDSNKTYGIKGRNGSGKSTLLKMLSGYLQYTKGEINYYNQNKLIKPTELFKHISISAPYIELDEELNPSEIFNHLKHFADFKQSNAKDFTEQLSFVSKNKTVDRYSSGMKQKLGLQIAFSANKPLLLLDEPSSYLDEVNRAWMMDSLKQELGKKTIIIASNDEKDFEFCEQIIELSPNQK